MNLSLTNDEAALVRYACDEMANRRAQQALDSIAHQSSWSRDVAESNEREAKQYRAIAERIRQAD